MTMHPPGEDAGASGFGALMAEATAATGRFGHREHVHLTWLAVRHPGVPAAVSLVSDGIQRTARYAGPPRSTTRPSAGPGWNWLATTRPNAAKTTSPRSSATTPPCSTSACWPASTVRQR
jgi:hypothetical protein